MPDKYRKIQFDHGKRKILAVEDERINREILGMKFRDTYDVISAETGGQTMEILETDCGTLSLVLPDLNLPDMKGIDILRRIKSGTGCKRTRRLTTCPGKPQHRATDF